MSEKPPWLPDLFMVQPWSLELYDRLYTEVFCRGDYAIIMRKMADDSRRVITAYWVEFEHERKKLRRKCERRLPS